MTWGMSRKALRAGGVSSWKLQCGSTFVWEVCRTSDWLLSISAHQRRFCAWWPVFSFKSHPKLEFNIWRGEKCKMFPLNKPVSASTGINATSRNVSPPIKQITAEDKRPFRTVLLCLWWGNAVRFWWKWHHDCICNVTIFKDPRVCVLSVSPLAGVKLFKL